MSRLMLLLQDNVVAAMYASTGQEQKMAQEVLTTLKEHPDSWTKVGGGEVVVVGGLWASEDTVTVK